MEVIAPPMAFSIFPHLPSKEFRGVSWAPLKTLGHFFPLSIVHVALKKKKMRFTQFLLHRYGLDLNQIF